MYFTKVINTRTGELAYKVRLSREDVISIIDKGDTPEDIDSVYADHPTIKTKDLFTLIVEKLWLKEWVVESSININRKSGTLVGNPDIKTLLTMFSDLPIWVTISADDRKAYEMSCAKRHSAHLLIVVAATETKFRLYDTYMTEGNLYQVRSDEDISINYHKTPWKNVSSSGKTIEE